MITWRLCDQFHILLRNTIFRILCNTNNWANRFWMARLPFKIRRNFMWIPAICWMWNSWLCSSFQNKHLKESLLLLREWQFGRIRFYRELHFEFNDNVNSNYTKISKMFLMQMCCAEAESRIMLIWIFFVMILLKWLKRKL